MQDVQDQFKRLSKTVEVSMIKAALLVLPPQLYICPIAQGRLAQLVRVLR